jgi:hypothetical protein
MVCVSVSLLTQVQHATHAREQHLRAETARVKAELAAQAEETERLVSLTCLVPRE